MLKIKEICKPDYTDDAIALVNDLSTIDFARMATVMPEAAVLAFVRTGTMQINVEGEEVTVAPDRIFFTSPGKIMHSPRFSADFIGHALVLNMRFGHQIITTTGNIWSHISRLNADHIFALPPDTVTVLNQYYTLLTHEVKRRDNVYYNEIIPSLMRNLLYTVINDILKVSAPVPIESTGYASGYKGSPQALALFQRFFEMLTDGKCTHRSIKYYSDRLCVSAKYLSTVCKAISQRTARQWICDAMANGIDNMLRTTDMSAKEISVIFDFPNLSAFCKFVKKHLGASPTQLRRRTQA